MIRRIACFTPTQAEFVDAYRLLEETVRMDEGSFVAASGRLHGAEVVLVRTGMGQANTIRAAQQVLDRLEIAECLLLGFGGGTRHGLKVTDLVACSELIDSAGNAKRVLSSAALVRRAKRTGHLAATSPAVTVPRVITSAAAKLDLGERYGAAVVEMEGFHLLSLSSRLGVPGLVVRAILDTVEDDFPDVAHLISSSGEPRMAASVAHLALHPTHAFRIPGLLRRAKACRRAMSRFLRAYLSR
jgi:adenosylhomocysteine nucleosidase